MDKAEARALTVDLSKGGGVVDDHSGEVQAKARALLESGGIRAISRSGRIFRARGSEGNFYRVIVLRTGADKQTYAVTCTCPNGKHLVNLPRCYHSLAALMIMEDPGKWPEALRPGTLVV